MSIYNFIASDKPMDELCVGIQEINKNTIAIPDETKTLNIFIDNDCTYSSVYTNLPHIMCIEFSVFKNISNIFFNYIKKQMENHNFLEIWSTWMDEKEVPEHKSINIKDLSTYDLEWIYGQEYYLKPKRLKIYKWK